MDEPTPAGFWIRLCAHAFDFWIFILAYMLCVFGVGVAQGFFKAGSDVVGLLSFLFLLLLWIADGVYYMLLSIKGRRTLGKRLMGLQVVDMEGRELTAKKAVLRWLGYHVAYIPAGLGFVAAGFTREKRGLQDYVAGTKVVRTEPCGTPIKLIGLALSAALVAVPITLHLVGQRVSRRSAQQEPYVKEEGARMALTVLRRAVEEYQVERGVFPSSLTDPGLVGHFLREVPRLDLPYAGHRASSEVEVGSCFTKSGRLDMSRLRNTGRWAYDPAWGRVFIDSTERDLRGQPYYTW